MAKTSKMARTRAETRFFQLKVPWNPEIENPREKIIY